MQTDRLLVTARTCGGDDYKWIEGSKTSIYHLLELPIVSFDLPGKQYIFNSGAQADVVNNETSLL
jgi:hypothetical protein